MASKRKSVTFRETVSMMYSKTFDGSSSPSPINITPAAVYQPLPLDPMYLRWLRLATKAHFPFIVNGTFATHVYHQNFDEHVYIRIKNNKQLQRAQQREAAVPALVEKYGSLGWGNLYWEVSKNAWVKNYREIYRFDGSDEQLLERIAEAYAEIKCSIAREEIALAQFTQNGSFDGPVCDLPWESFTQGAGALISPDFGPDGVNVTFDNTTEAPYGEDGLVQASMRDQGANGQKMWFDMGVESVDFGNSNEVLMLSAGS